MITTRLGTAASKTPAHLSASALLDRAPNDLPYVEPIEVRYRVAKRAFDIVVASTFLILAFVPMALIWLVIRLTSKGPALYKCERIGRSGRPFMFLKFRSMRVDADEALVHLLSRNEKDGPIFKIESDPRITRVGLFLRRYSLDELPQVIHVLTGEMSIVGPRPHLRREVMFYDDGCLDRLSVKPGLTCYWQIGGRSDLSFEQWIDMDRQYIDDMSFWTDLKILAKTPAAILSCRGAY